MVQTKKPAVGVENKSVVAASLRPLVAEAALDRSLYTQLPTLDLESAVALAQSLAQVSPPNAPAALGEERDRMCAVATQCEAAIVVRLGQTTRDVRSYDTDMDRAWRLFVTRLRDYGELPAERTPKAATAKQIAGLLGDLTILTYKYPAEYKAIEARLRLLTERGLLDDARALAGEPFFAEVKHCHEAYGRALGITQPLESSTPDVDLGEHLRAMLASIGDYVFQVLALARSSVEGSTEQARRALKPIDDAREAAARSRATEVSEPKPEPQPAPLPEPQPAPKPVTPPTE